MKKSTRRRPELESLETLVLLSTVAAHAHHVAGVPAHVAPPVAVTLSGTARLAEDADQKLAFLESTFTYSGTAQLRSIGQVSAHEADHTYDGVSYFILSTRRGNIDLRAVAVGSTSSLAGYKVNGSSISYARTTGSSADYTITGGTGSYAGATGSGTVVYTSVTGPRFSQKYELKFV